MNDHDEDNLKANENDVPRFTPPLAIQRYQKVADIIKNEKTIEVRKVIDFGCAEGRFLRYLKKITSLNEIIAVDLIRANLLECDYTAKPICWDYMFGRECELTISLYEGDVLQLDSRLFNYDAITCIELIEHLHEKNLEKFSENVFKYFQPKMIIVTTPNFDYNVLFDGLLSNGKYRHWDHKFEWTKQQFRNWCDQVIENYPDYQYQLDGVGEPSPGQEHIGYCSQIAIFRKFKSQSNLNLDHYDSLINYSLFNTYFYPECKNKEKIDCNGIDEPSVDWDSIR